MSDALFNRVLDRIAAMPSNATLSRRIRERGLDIVHVTWEDTARDKNSCWGPNIADMTLELAPPVDGRESWTDRVPLPVLRYPNFADRSADLPLEKIRIPTGNHAGEALRSTPLAEVLADLPSFLSDPSTFAGPAKSLLTERDSHVLVSAQACFLPIPRGSKVEFNPRLFSYQSQQGDPAVLVLLVTPEGTSAMVTGDDFTRLYFNENGQRANLTGERTSDVVAQGGEPGPGANQVFVVQVPLRQRAEPEAVIFESLASSVMAGSAMACEDLEDAVIGHGGLLGPHAELEGLELERDERFPIRITVQLYLATEHGLVTDEELATLHERIDAVYGPQGSNSLVVNGETGRPTEHQVPPQWWWWTLVQGLPEE